jgi:hypothetical protein
MMALEEKFDLQLDEEGAEKITNVQEAADMICAQVQLSHIIFAVNSVVAAFIEYTLVYYIVYCASTCRMCSACATVLYSTIVLHNSAVLQIESK